MNLIRHPLGREQLKEDIMVSVPPVSLGNAAGWAEARIPSTENTGMTSMLQAAALSQQAQLRKQEIEKGKKAARDEKRIEQYQSLFVDAHAVKDRKLMAEAINGIAEINPDKAKQVKDTWFNLDRTDAVSGAMALQAAAASPTDEGQKAALKQAYDIFSMSSVPLAESVKGIMDTPFGEKRDTQIFTGIKVAQAMGLLPAPKDVFGTPKGASGSDGVHSVHFFEDGSAVGITKDKKSVYFDKEGNELTGKARTEAIAKARKSGVDIEAMKKEAVESAKAKVTNYQDLVSTGKNAADNLPDILTTLDLLQRVKTGGWEGVKLRVKNFLGVESEDEATLTNLMAENMLKKLRPTFGGAFSAQETKFMENISAGIKKSGPGNIGIYKQVADKYRFYINRAMKEAEIKGDKDTVRYLQYSLDRMDQMFPKKGTPASAQQATPAATPQPNVPAAAGQPNTPASVKGPTVNQNEINSLNKAKSSGATSYKRSTGQYGYIDNNGNFIPVQIP